MSGLSTKGELRDFFCRRVPEQARSRLAGLGDVNSAGSLAACFEPPLPSFTLRLAGGELLVSEGLDADVLACLRTTPESLAVLAERGPVAAASAPPSPARSELVERLLRLDPARAARLRAWQGSITLVLTDAGTEHRFEFESVSPAPAEGRASCLLRLSLDDAAAILAGSLAPLQVMMSGQLVMEGDAQPVMALLTALG